MKKGPVPNKETNIYRLCEAIDKLGLQYFNPENLKIKPRILRSTLRAYISALYQQGFIDRHPYMPKTWQANKPLASAYLLGKIKWWNQ